MPAGKPRVLVVDDNVSALLVLRRLLRDTPCLLETVRSARQARQVLEAREVALAVAEQALPDGTGAALLAELERRRPDARRLLLTGADEAAGLADGERRGRYRLFVRPFDTRDLVRAIVEALTPSAEEELDVGQPSADDWRDTAQIVIAQLEARGSAGDAVSREPPPLGRALYGRALRTLAELVEAKVGASPGHGARVAALAAELGREAGVAERDVRLLEEAAILHDAGELVLEPPTGRIAGPLPSELQASLWRHAEAGERIARRAGLEEPAIAAIHHHHERWDGDGYPARLAGEAIPVGARILAVADTWDALATDRPYRRAVPLDGATDLLRALAGSQLDPDLVRYFLERRLFELIDWTDPPRPELRLP